MGVLDRRRPYDGPPDPPDPTPPKDAGGSPGQPPSGLPYMTAETGIALPICYGTMRAAGNIIERYAYTFASTAVAQIGRSATYALGDIGGNFGNLYICAVAGTTAGTGDGPTTKTSGITDGTVTWDYVQYGYRHFVALGLCEGQIYGVGKAWQDKKSFTAYTDLPHDMTTAGGIQLALGTSTGDRPGITGGTVFWFPVDNATSGLRMIYGNTAVLWIYLNTGSDADLAEIQLEVKGVLADATHTDANPADIAIDLLTHTRRGAGWPSARVDSASTGTGDAASWKNYCTATGFILSWNIDQQTAATDLIKMLLAATNSDAYMTNKADGSGWMIRFVPLGTDSITANGATFTPNLTPAYSIGIDDMLEPPEVETIPDTDRFNSMPVQFIDRARDYATGMVDDPDMADVELRGLVRSSTLTFPMVMAPEAAIQLSRIKAQRSLNVATNHRLTLPFRYMLVEPTDLLTWGETLIGFSNVPIRVTVWQEDQESGNIVIEAEDFPANVGAAATYTPQTGDGFKPAVSTALGALQVLPGQASQSTVPTASQTGSNYDNLWPNHNSETDPPDGVNTATAEWDGRLNVGTANAYNGKFVRQLSAGSGARVSLGDPGSLDGIPSNECSLARRLPCSPGETFYIEAQAKITSGSAGTAAGVYIFFFDSTGTRVTVSVTTTQATAPASSWTKVSAQATTPPNAVQVMLYCFVDTNISAATAQFDAIYARRMIDLKLFPVEPWGATRIVAACNVSINAAGTSASYGTTASEFTYSGFDIGNPPTLVQVGSEPQKRLRLTLASLPNGVAFSDCHFSAVAVRNSNGVSSLADVRLELYGWNQANLQLDFFAKYISWSGGTQTINHPFAWSSIDGTNGSLWDVIVAIFPKIGVGKFFA